MTFVRCVICFESARLDETVPALGGGRICIRCDNLFKRHRFGKTLIEHPNWQEYLAKERKKEEETGI